MSHDEDLEQLEPGRLEDLVEWDALIDKAEVCIACGMQPSEYDALSDAERAAFVEVVNRRKTDQ